MKIRVLPKTKGEWIRLLALAAIFGWLFFVFGWGPASGFLRYRAQDGDIIFQSLPRQFDLVKAIEGITHSPYTHCGVVVKRRGKWLVLESIGNVRYTTLWRWVIRGRGGRFAVYRLAARYKPDIPEFVKAMEGYLGRPYDYQYRLDDESIYCSELVYKGFLKAAGERLGSLVKLGDLDWEPWREVIQKYEGYGKPIPVRREMITPRDLARARQLKMVFDNGI